MTLGALGAAVVLGSQALRHIPLTGPLLALGVGAALGPEGLAVFRIPDGHAVLNTVSEIAMAIALMAVALRYPFSDVAKLARPLTLLLTVGMVGMAATVALLAWGLLGLEPAHAWLLGAVLAPTDPVLSSSIVTGDPAEKDIPYRLRRLLSAESGANDGLAFPLVVLGVVLMREEGLGRFITEGLIGVAIAVVAGIAIGWAAGALMLRSEEHQDIEDSGFFVFTLVLALLALGVVNMLKGDGILGVFVTGLAYNRTVGAMTYDKEREVEEGINRVLVLPVFILLGSLLPWLEWTEAGLPLVGFGVAVLFLRRLPVIAALRRPLKLDAADTLFYGWFGPIGVAALFLVTFAIEEAVDDTVIWPATALVVALSTVVHGLTGTPGRAAYARTRQPNSS